MELEIKHLAPYLPYGLNVVHIFRSKKEYHKLVKCDHSNVDIIGVGSFLQDRNTYQPMINVGLNKIKPILRPLSDLMKTGNNDMSDLPYDFTDVQESMLMKNELHEQVCWRAVNILFRYHYDVFGLIEKGLAIDINTLNS